MKKLILVVLCLCLASCGTFDVKVQILPTATAGAPAATVISPAVTAIPPTATVTSIVARPTPTEADPAITLTNIQMNDASQGWAVTSAGHIVHTGNGGAFWHDITPSQGTFDRDSLFALNNKTAWAVSNRFESTNWVWRTQDGGNTWKASGPLPVGAGVYNPIRLQFPDNQHGWLLAQNDDHLILYKSANSGQDWMQITSITDDVAQAYLPVDASMAFLDGERGWLGGTWEQNEWRTLKTTNGGERWGTDTFRLPQQKNIQCNGHSVAQIMPGSLAVEVQCSIAKDPKYAFHHVYYLSEKTGDEWHSWALSGKLVSIHFLNVNLGWMMVTSDQSQLNKILQTRDGGETWKTISLVEWKQARFNFVTDKIGWAIVSNNTEITLFHTEDSGKTWVQVRPFVSP